jgi:hypothetical protein
MQTFTVKNRIVGSCGSGQGLVGLFSVGVRTYHFLKFNPFFNDCFERSLQQQKPRVAKTQRFTVAITPTRYSQYSA